MHVRVLIFMGTHTVLRRSIRPRSVLGKLYCLEQSDDHEVINIAYATFIVEDSYKSLTCFGPIPVAPGNSI